MIRKPLAAFALIAFVAMHASSSASESPGALGEQSHGTRQSVVKLDRLTWRAGAGSPPVVSVSSATAITQKLVAISPKDPKKRVIAGFNEYGGGYHWSSILEGFEWNGEVGQPGYGRGFLGAIRDQMHLNAYNPEQAGLNDFEGVRAKSYEQDRSVIVPQFQMALYDDGSGGGRSRFPFKDYASEFDFSAVTEDVSKQFGIPTFMHEEYYAYARSPQAIRQFLQGRILRGPGVGRDVLDTTQRVEDVSSAPGNQTPRDTDLSLVVHTIRGIRPPAAFNNLLYRSNGRWVSTPLEANPSRSKRVFCEVTAKENKTYQYADSGRAIVPRNKPNCAADVQLIVFSTSPDPARGTAMALYVPGEDPLNAVQTHIVNRDTMSVERSEDRRVQTGIFVAKFVRNRHSEAQGFWFAGARNVLSGLLSPDSASDYFGKDHIEILTDKSYLLFGTPDEIWGAISAKGRKAEPSFGSARGG